ncbi:MAG TPA: WecB/TagA/CpsF family glycosyltransferase [Ktedonobacterales bacterium]|nr:WecB/TagA/CpsF family glycosyltransferase [Ktedonobacterales bacterium]
MAVLLETPPRLLARDRVNLLGTRIDRIRMGALEQWLESFMLSRQPHQIITANLDFIAIARRQPAFAALIEGADLVVCDGKPLQWASQLQGEPIPNRVTGMDLVQRTALLSVERGYRIFFLGAAPGVAERAADGLRRLFPGVVLVGSYSPPLGPIDDEENARMVERVRSARPDALFVALGAPRQDYWIQRNLTAVNVPLCAGVGGVLNFLAGETRRAPEWIQRCGFEWAYRLLQEPSRLWRRYLVDDLPLFFELLARQGLERLRAGRARLAPAPVMALAGGPALDAEVTGVTFLATIPVRQEHGPRVLPREPAPVAARARVRKRSCRAW